jgi:prophage regulatory protein
LLDILDNQQLYNLRPLKSTYSQSDLHANEYDEARDYAETLRFIRQTMGWGDPVVSETPMSTSSFVEPLTSGLESDLLGNKKDGIKADKESHQNSVFDDKAISTNDAHVQEKSVQNTSSHICTDAVYMTIKEVMDKLKLSKSTIYAKMQSGNEYYDPTFPKKYLVGDRAKRFKKSEIEAWMASREIL